MLTCHDVAKYFLTLADEDAGDLISNLKLQKLVYYAQGFHLALNDAPLFEERIEAWQHGPVVPDLYRAYSPFGSAPLPGPTGFDIDQIDTETQELLDEVYEVFGQYSAWKLRNLTHEEPPWKDIFRRGVSYIEITQESMAEYFKTQLN